MKEKKHSQSVQPVQCENGWEVHSIADVCSMKEKKRETSFAFLTLMGTKNDDKKTSDQRGQRGDF